MSFMLLISVLIIFSTIQSVLGVGLLVFGTPTLLIMGFSFEETLSIVLPASICISLLQVIEPQKSGKSFRKEFNLFCLPFVFLGVYYVLLNEKNIDLSIYVGGMLFISGAIRLSSKLTTILSSFIFQYRKLYQVILGLVHGLTNMGGGLLTLFSSSIHSGDKNSTRAGVAYGYLLMGVIQYGMLLFFHPEFISIKIVLYVLIAAVSYLLFGKRLYVNTQEKLFHNSVTAIILFYGCVLIFR
ncbi:TSUP family transporter [Halobacteriovorax sp. HLS]|uniref:TSUP family transporter n=1 Tax=Halobacteriovorax sp. HLS TaxID=2234000 RepID=UPI000FDC25B7|nr:TSUP family transporter [Halobacteriovorax sp. HLS]